MGQEPGQDRTGDRRSFAEFRERLVSEGRLPPIWRPKSHLKAPERKPSDRPNVLWLMADELRADTFGFMDHPIVRTPNTDRLAREGAVFTRMFCAEPVCVPAQASLLTGRYPFAHGAVSSRHRLRSEEEGFPALLAHEGYRTVNIGKHQAGCPPSAVWQEQYTVEDVFGATRPSKVPFDPDNFPDVTFIGNEVCDNPERILHGRYPGPIKLSKSYLLAAEAQRWLYWNDDPRPFLLRVSFDDPHPPVIPPDPFFGMYSPDAVPADLWQEQGASLTLKPATVRQYREFMGYDRIPLEDHKRHAACYFGLVTHLDTQVGRILDYLDELGLAENTIVILNSDHGHMLGEHGLVQVGPFCYEGVLRVPTIIRWRGHVRPYTRVESVAHAVDLMPTVLDLLGLPVPPGIHGQSLVPLMEGATDGHREHAFAHWEDYVFCIRGKRWKLTQYDSDGEGELYDLLSDPWEKQNLYREAAARAVRDDLLDRLRQWRAEHARREDLPQG